MRREVVSTRDGAAVIDRDVVDSLKVNGTYLPDVEKVMFSLKTSDRRRATDADGNPVFDSANKPVYETYSVEPTLATKVWWADGTTTTVKNSKDDPVEVVTVEVDGVPVEVASDRSKEVGLAMAVVKRTCGRPGPDGEIADSGMGRILREIVGGATDTAVEGAKARAAAAKRKAEAAARASAASAKKRRYTEKDIVRMLGPILERMLESMNTAPEPESKGAKPFQDACPECRGRPSTKEETENMKKTSTTACCECGAAKKAPAKKASAKKAPAKKVVKTVKAAKKTPAKKAVKKAARA